MINRLKHIWQLLVLYAFLMLTGILVISLAEIQYNLLEYVLLLSVMAAITMGAYLMMSVERKEERGKGLFVLAAIGFKFVAYLFVILLFWVKGKNLSKEFIIGFFILYLVFTFFLLRILFKTLNSN